MWTGLKIAHSSAIPADGVLVIAAEFGVGWDIPLDTDLAAIYVEVSGEGGELINGVLELSDSPLAIIWRPDEPLMPNLTYDIIASVDNTIFGDLDCGEDFFSVEGSIETRDPGLPETAVPPLAIEEELYPVKDFSLDQLVCCDGALPSMDSCGGIDGSWGEGHCASMNENWRVDLAVTLDADVMEANGGQIGVAGWVAGDLLRTVSFGADDCVQTSAVNFATGETVSGEEVCVSPASAAELGPKPVDPSEELDAECVDEPYTCEVVDGIYWEGDNCDAWPATGDSDSVSSTDAGTDTTSDSDSSGTAGETTSDSGGVTTVTDTATGTSEDSTGDDSASSSSAGEDGETGGCACDVAGGSPAGFAWLTLALPIFWRRRRSS